MANVSYIQEKIYYGYGQAAKRLGYTFDIYHAASPIDPIVPGNLIGSLPASFNQNWAYNKANKYGNNIWQMVADGRLPPNSVGFNVGDYFVGQDYEGRTLTFFVIGMQTLLPILSVSCNGLVTIQRATQDANPYTPGGYSGYVPSTSTTLASNLPVSILNMNIGRNNPENLPTDTLIPKWVMLMPYLGGVVFKNRDIVIDAYSNRYVIASTELTDLGWRCGIEQLGA